jgi:hypothetical protein
MEPAHWVFKLYFWPFVIGRIAAWSNVVAPRVLKQRNSVLLSWWTSKACPHPSISSNKIGRISMIRAFGLFRSVDVVEIDQIAVKTSNEKRRTKNIENKFDRTSKTSLKKGTERQTLKIRYYTLIAWQRADHFPGISKRVLLMVTFFLKEKIVSAFCTAMH